MTEMSYENYCDLCDRLDRIDERLEKMERILEVRPDKRGSNLLTIKEAAKEYKLSASTLYRMPEAQVRVGGSIRISRTKMESHFQRAPGRLP